MGSLPVDVVRCALQRFAERDLPAVLDVLDHPVVDDEAVLRAVVERSGGSLSRLQHYLEACAAEGLEGLARPEPRRAPAHLPPAAPADHHRLLRGARFELGSVLYVVADRQLSEQQVCCYRIDGGVAAVTRLPAAFVYEQLAEPVEMSVPGSAELG